MEKTDGDGVSWLVSLAGGAGSDVCCDVGVHARPIEVPLDTIQDLVATEMAAAGAVVGLCEEDLATGTAGYAEAGGGGGRAAEIKQAIMDGMIRRRLLEEGLVRRIGQAGTNHVVVQGGAVAVKDRQSGKEDGGR